MTPNKQNESYDWAKQLVKKITRSDFNPNNHIPSWYNRYEVNTQSGTRDYIAVYVQDKQTQDNVLDFSFDFWTKELVLSAYKDEKTRDVLYQAFHDLYDGGITVVDEPGKEYLKEERKLYDEMMSHVEDYVPEAVKEQRALVAKLECQYGFDPDYDDLSIDAAKDYLREKGYKIMEKVENHVLPDCDFLARKDDKIVFVLVNLQEDLRQDKGFACHLHNQAANFLSKEMGATKVSPRFDLIVTGTREKRADILSHTQNLFALKRQLKKTVKKHTGPKIG